jgi:hypothetical protein
MSNTDQNEKRRQRERERKRERWLQKALAPRIERALTRIVGPSREGERRRLCADLALQLSRLEHFERRLYGCQSREEVEDLVRQFVPILPPMKRTKEIYESMRGETFRRARSADRSDLTYESQTHPLLSVGSVEAGLFVGSVEAGLRLAIEEGCAEDEAESPVAVNERGE